LIDKKFQLRKGISKKNNNKKNDGQSWYKKLNQILNDRIEKKEFKIKYITIKKLKTKFDMINK